MALRASRYQVVLDTDGPERGWRLALMTSAFAASILKSGRAAHRSEARRKRRCPSTESDRSATCRSTGLVAGSRKGEPRRPT
jgi:hypothetical protein